MRSRIVRLSHELPLASILVATLTVGCTQSDAPTSPQTEMTAVSTRLTDAELQAATGRGVDAEFTRLAKRIPGFGGMYYDRTGRLHVYMKAAPGGAALRSTDVVGTLRSAGNAAVQRRLNKSGGNVVTQAAKYDYNELQAYRNRLAKIFSVRGVVFTDTDEGKNRLRVGIEPGAKEQDVVRVLARAGVPRDVVIISRVSAAKRVKTLQDRFRPVPGGAQIVFPAPSEGPGLLFVCSVGFNARLASRPRKEFFVTASHCSDIQGGNQRTPYFQPLPGGRPNTDKIAVEFKDPGYGDAGGLCVYQGVRCRLSDALLARYTDPNFSDFGTIARTTFALQRIGALKINDRNPRWTVVGELGFPFLNEIAHKVGRTSGHTFGPVIFTCVDTGVSGTDIVQICQDWVLSGAQGGDSGAGVFEQAGADEVLLVGILWGAGTVDGAPVFIFSAMEQIEQELGPLNTSDFDLLASAQ